MPQWHHAVANLGLIRGQSTILADLVEVFLAGWRAVREVNRHNLFICWGHLQKWIQSKTVSWWNGPGSERNTEMHMTCYSWLPFSDRVIQHSIILMDAIQHRATNPHDFGQLRQNAAFMNVIWFSSITNAPVAQWLEWLPENWQVGGSSPWPQP